MSSCWTSWWHIVIIMINDILLSSYHDKLKSPRDVDKTLTGLQINMKCKWTKLYKRSCQSKKYCIVLYFLTGCSDSNSFWCESPYHVSIHRHVIIKSLMNVRKLKKRHSYRYSSLVLLLKAPAGKFCNLFLDKSLGTN